MKTPIQFKDDDDIVEICKDNVFKAVFTKDIPASRNALSCLISALIGRKVDIVSILANELPVDNVRDRQLRFDINCRAKDGELINVEMSFHPKSFEPVRLEFHTAKLFTGQDIRGKEKYFSDLKEAYQIAILANERFFPDETFFHSFEYYDPENDVPLNGKTRIVTLELSKLESVVKKSINEMSTKEHWAVYFRYLTDRNKRGIINEIVKYEEGIAMASEVVMTISRDEEERARIMRDEKILLDWQSEFVYARREGRREGRSEGIREGRSEGIREGKQELKQTIINMAKSGKTLDEIINSI